MGKTWIKNENIYAQTETTTNVSYFSFSNKNKEYFTKAIKCIKTKCSFFISIKIKVLKKVTAIHHNQYKMHTVFMSSWKSKKNWSK